MFKHVKKTKAKIELTSK